MRHEIEFLCSPDETLLSAIRNGLGLTGTKEGCGTGDCGACSVILNDRLVVSCLVLAAEAQGRSLTTIEGVARAGLAGIAVIAGSTIAADSQAMIEAADKAGLFIQGLSA